MGTIISEKGAWHLFGEEKCLIMFIIVILQESIRF